MSKTLQFSKMHGLGNDFIVIDAINQPYTPNPELIQQWSNRHSGIGFDQMLVVETAQNPDAAFKYRIYNADGGEVSQCGNGARCFARFVREQGLTDLDIIPVETNAGMLELEMLDASQVRVNMGVPDFEPKRIPLAFDHRDSRYQINLGAEVIDFSAVAIGNPHMVIVVDDVERAALERLGPVLESHSIFPERVNVGFIQIIDRQCFKLRVYERGVGETRACGSGACAAMVCAQQLGLLETRARAILSGGELNLEWQGEGKPVMMSGDTAMVYKGEIEYE